MNVFTKRLKEARTRMGLSQKQLGIQAGLDPSVASPRMNQYEKGTHLPDINTTKKISEVLGVPVAYLYCEDDDLAEVIEGYSRLSECDKQTIKSLLN
ncbi:helix-turn-helix domain-containing protein [Marinomonas spartinae]|uniref:helix-turn-helix domain-containing protein n=1 Tax=Marinomonas spartinae TaxID=1792290 RepID=UPI0018F131D7|nr:helix-turn-helix transcriptional regulator [Marinomonas spartinae]MBJ7554050.1 helix-turn-helix transcriptional regulator [Marinomonas spartinae]